MEKPKPSRRKSRKPKIENYYKILGTRSNASQETIKKKYIESVKSFPPETHPEEFQRIRRAYETLRDPVKRREYDLMRKYGGKIERIMEEALAFAEDEQWDKAANLLHQARKIAPDNMQICLALGQIALLQDDEQTFQEQFELAGNLAPENEKALILALKARLLLEKDRPEEALEILEYARAQYPEHGDLLQSMYIDVYKILGREDDLWALTMDTLPSPDSRNPEDIFVYIHWINIMIELEKWDVWSAVQLRTRKFLKAIQDEEDKLMVITALLSEHNEYFETGCFREAMLFIDLAHNIDSKNPHIKQQRRKTRELLRVEKELDRLCADPDIFPLVSTYAIEWFYEKYTTLEDTSQIREKRISILENLYSDYGDYIDINIADGVLAIRRKYPLIYNSFQAQWDELLNERATAHRR
ncbi:DnaJ domain-containing protein [Desulfallas sp. Bu1-1]|jgi:tetratricopeptide (TPR) repeat protein|uniref:DnaJ domain-containing protein n=1 Tax=Desulfallas sp. Bu1-1 TaxID=2787620 RepID=UPI00189D391A|nr:DnaJ domain-containing protein [Desulfallas sp. Bu1-1]MBF7081461.1 DnaJ domain-containing protein [Desulfallas sp. Bu1-1]